MGGFRSPGNNHHCRCRYFYLWPKKLPELGAGLGKSIRDFKAAMSGQDSPGDEDKKESEKKEPEKKDANK